MHEVRVAPFRLAKNVSLVSDRWPAASTRAPITPNDAASVAVAQPRYIEPITNETNRITGIRNRDSLILSTSVVFGSGGGTSCLRAIDQNTM